MNLLFLFATVPLPFPISNPQFSLDSRFASQSCFKSVCIYQCGFSFLFLSLLVFSVDAIFQDVLVISINALFPIQVDYLIFWRSFQKFVLARMVIFSVHMCGLGLEFPLIVT